MKIIELKLFTTNLSKQLDFYSRTLELEIKDISKNSVSFKIGKSTLTFESREDFTPYHFAVNIPANKEKDALRWLKKRVEILKCGKNEIQYFDFWNAYAIYFYDNDNNVVEFIARKNMKNDSDREFDQNSLLEISEIGLPTDNIEKEFEILNKKAGLNIFSGSFDVFCAVGGETGLFICINKDLKHYWFPTKDKPYSSDFSILIKQNEKKHLIDYQNEILKVVDNI